MSELLVMIEIAGRRCVLPAHEVSSVIEVGTLTPVPGTPKHISGITALRSQTLTVVDCRHALGLDPADYPTDERAAAVNVGKHAYALVVDRIEDIITAQSETDEIVGGFGSEWTRVGRGMVETSSGPALMIDPERLIAGPEALEDAA